MKYIDEPIRTYIEDASSGKPTPGGGSIAGFTGALSCTMLRMVCNFTTGKKKYADVQEQIDRILEKGTRLTEDLLKLTVDDTKAYSQVSAAYGMPKDSDEEKSKRSRAIQDACKAAMKVPEDISAACHEILRLLNDLADIGNPNLITDTGVSALLAFAALESAALNVTINLKFIRDDAFTAQKSGQLNLRISDSEVLKNAIMEKVNKAVSG